MFLLFNVFSSLILIVNVFISPVLIRKRFQVTCSYCQTLCSNKLLDKIYISYTISFQAHKEGKMIELKVKSGIKYEKMLINVAPSLSVVIKSPRSTAS